MNQEQYEESRRGFTLFTDAGLLRQFISQAANPLVTEGHSGGQAYTLVEKAVGHPNIRAAVTERISDLRRELGEIVAENGRLKAQRDQLAELAGDRETLYHDLHELRDAMGCDGSDLPQLLAKWDAVQEELAGLKAIVGKLHPRVLKLAGRDEPFIVIGCREPYFLAAYGMIREQENRQGTWSGEDERRLDEATQAHKRYSEAAGKVGDVTEGAGQKTVEAAWERKHWCIYWTGPWPGYNAWNSQTRKWLRLEADTWSVAVDRFEEKTGRRWYD